MLNKCRSIFTQCRRPSRSHQRFCKKLAPSTRPRSHKVISMPLHIFFACMFNKFSSSTLLQGKHCMHVDYNIFEACACSWKIISSSSFFVLGECRWAYLRDALWQKCIYWRKFHVSMHWCTNLETRMRKGMLI
jgi:hypothetical protein